MKITVKIVISVQLISTIFLSKQEIAAREESPVKNMKHVSERDGNVLVPVDTVGRLIELAVQLNNVWEQRCVVAGC